MKRLLSVLLLLLVQLLPGQLSAKQPTVTVDQDGGGALLRVDGKPFMVKGVVWGYGPIGTNYAYSLWKQPRSLILRVLNQQMPLLKAAGFNAIRVFDMPPPEWIQYIYEKYGIFTTFNDMLGRYGMTMNGVWVAHTDYADPEQRRFLLGELDKLVVRYRNTPGVLMWLLGNENNYGLSWTGAGAENFPGEKDPERAAHLYSLMSEAAQLVKRRDPTRPVALVNGDLNYLDVIAKHKAGLDIFGTNQYRGRSVGAMYREVQQKLGIPVLFTEFGADCFDNRTGQEDSLNQARFLHAQWREIYEQSHGKGGVGNALGGFVFEWTDTWWKVGQSYGLSDHDTLGTWSHPPYYDYEDSSENNMQEEWWGITALTPTDGSGFYEPEPRTAFYMLRDIFRIDPYADGTSVASIRRAFAAIHPEDYQGAYLASEAGQHLALRVSNLLVKLEMTGSRGTRSTARGGDLVLDHTESAFVDFTLEPSSKLYARLSLNLVANVAQNRLDPIFYENPTSYEGAVLGDARRTRIRPADIYQAEIKAEHRWFNLHGFYRVGHPGWDYEGDLFHLYPQAYYQEAVDMYRAPAPFGAVVSGRRVFDGLKLAIGPQLYWGANPALIGKYSRQLGPLTLTAMHQEDLAEASSSALASSAVTPEPVSRKSMLGVSAAIGEAQLDVGGLFAAPQRVGDAYTRTEPSSGPGYAGSGYDVFREKIQWQDTLGAKVKLLVPSGRAAFYVQGAAKGLVADAGPDTSYTITGWSLKESGRGNQLSGMAGVAIAVGELQVAPNLLYQRPLVGPNPRIDGVYDPATQTYSAPVRARTTYTGVTPHEPFAVLDNRETAAAELLITFDPTPATPFYQWDRFNREDAPFAANVDFVYRHQPTSRDSEVAVLDNGQRFAFGAAPPAHDAWDASFNVAAAALPPVRLFGSLFAGQNQALGDDPRLVTRYGGSLRVGFYDFLLATRLHLNDWGPYDYFRDYNLTYPLQWYGDASWGFTPALIGAPEARFGVRGQYRRLDQHSDGWADKLSPGRSGSEFEITTYLHATL